MGKKFKQNTQGTIFDARPLGMQPTVTWISAVCL